MVEAAVVTDVDVFIFSRIQLSSLICEVWGFSRLKDTPAYETQDRFFVVPPQNDNQSGVILSLRRISNL
jgi:hypothetical protein